MDNLTLNPGAGGPSVATDDVAGVHVQRVKIMLGADGVNDGDASSTNPLPVSVSGVATASAQATGNALLGTIDTSAAAAVASLSVLDDWDETDRAKVNIIAGQAGVAAGAGVVGATVQRMTLASDDAQLGGVAETAPATDTASSGLNGRLQRLAQHLTSLIAQIPASLGVKTAANSLSIAPASDAKFVVQLAPAAALTNISGTVTTGGTAQNAAAANSSRAGFWIQNLSAGDLWISTMSTAAATQPALKITAGTYYEAPPGGAGTGAISVFGATTGQAWAGQEW